MMNRAFVYRIYPNAEQRALIEKTFGCCRWVYNHALDIKISAYRGGEKVPTRYQLDKMLPSWKAENAWLLEVDAHALQQELANLEKAYANFFRSPGRVGFPKFKSKRHDRASYRTNWGISVPDDRHVKLPKLGMVKAKISRAVLGRAISATISRTPTGKYFVSIGCADVPKKPLPDNGCAIGIDLGVKSLAVCSDGTVIENERHYGRSMRRLAREQRRLSRKRRGSKNYQKQRVKVARVHERIANSRKDHIHKATTAIVDENQVVCVEDLNAKGMMSNHKLAKSVADASFGEFVRQLEYKCEERGRTLVKVDRWFPSSKTCSACGHVMDEMPLSIREWTCPECGSHHDRDLNAARNILNKGIDALFGTVGHTGTGGDTADACGETGESAETRQ